MNEIGYGKDYSIMCKINVDHSVISIFIIIKIKTKSIKFKINKWFHSFAACYSMKRYVEQAGTFNTWS